MHFAFILFIIKGGIGNQYVCMLDKTDKFLFVGLILKSRLFRVEFIVGDVTHRLTTEGGPIAQAVPGAKLDTSSGLVM